MFVIRRKDDPLKILAFAYSEEPGQVRESFDTKMYEEVELDTLPDGYGMEPLPASLNDQLEAAFLQILPSHMGQPYLTDAIIAAIMQAKVAVIEANKIDASGTLTKAIIRGISLPAEMETARQQLLALVP